MAQQCSLILFKIGIFLRPQVGLLSVQGQQLRLGGSGRQFPLQPLEQRLDVSVNTPLISRSPLSSLRSPLSPLLSPLSSLLSPLTSSPALARLHLSLTGCCMERWRVPEKPNSKEDLGETSKDHE